MKINSRNITIALLGILTLVLGIASFYVGYTSSQKDTAPDDSSAAVSGACQFDYSNTKITATAVGGTCTFELLKFYEFAANQQSNIPSKYGQPVHCFSVQNEEKSTWTLTNGQVQTFDPATGGTGCGQCVQFDIVGQYGVSAYNGSCPIVGCNKSCGNGVADCSSGLSCISGKCRNSQFPDSTTCTGPKCGDGKVDAGEQCDDGNTNNNDSCTNDCKLPVVDPANFSLTSYCTVNNEYVATVAWSYASGQGTGQTSVRVDTDSNFERGDGYWQKLFSGTTTTSTTLPAGLTPSSASLPALNAFVPGQTYYVRVVDMATSTLLESSSQTTRSFVAESCVAEGCGDSCIDSSQCPSGHICGSGGTCILAACDNNPNCTNNGCTLPLPETGLFDSESNKLLLGILLLIVALILTQINIFKTSNSLYLSTKERIVSIKLPQRETKIQKSRKKFEEKVSRK